MKRFYQNQIKIERLKLEILNSVTFCLKSMTEFMIAVHDFKIKHVQKNYHELERYALGSDNIWLDCSLPIYPLSHLQIKRESLDTIFDENPTIQN